MQAAIDSAIPPPAAALGRGRIPQVDYLKGILITLMVLFHLSWFSTHYLDVTRYVYVFHMSGFIILSGFFANTGKTPGQFLKTWLGILAPYLVFESLYYLALSHLPASVPASNRLDPAFPAFWKALLLAPAGTYWYLYLLAVCLPVYYAVSRIPRLSPPARLAVCAALLAAVSWFNPAFQMIHAAYFLLGAFFRMTGLPILKCFFPTLWAGCPRRRALPPFPPPLPGRMLGLCLCMLTLSFLVKTCDSAGGPSGNCSPTWAGIPCPSSSFPPPSRSCASRWSRCWPLIPAESALPPCPWRWCWRPAWESPDYAMPWAGAGSCSSKRRCTPPSPFPLNPPPP